MNGLKGNVRQKGGGKCGDSGNKLVLDVDGMV